MRLLSFWRFGAGEVEVESSSEVAVMMSCSVVFAVAVPDVEGLLIVSESGSAGESGFFAATGGVSRIVASLSGCSIVAGLFTGSLMCCAIRTWLLAKSIGRSGKSLLAARFLTRYASGFGKKSAAGKVVLSVLLITLKWHRQTHEPFAV